MDTVHQRGAYTVRLTLGIALWLTALPAALAATQSAAANLLANGGFERAVPAAKAYAGGKWQFADGVAPAGWLFNNARPGRATMVPDTLRQTDLP